MTRWVLAITVALSAAWLPAAAASSQTGATGSSQAGATGSSQAGSTGSSQAGATGTSQAGATGTSQAGAAGDWSWPLRGAPSVVRGFQPPPMPWLAGHRGVDLLASPGAAVFAAGAGRVTFAGWVGGIPVVAVTHPDGRRTTYEPVLAAVVRGEVVARGAILGQVSAGGRHCLPRACLHWGLRLGSTYLDPLSLVGADTDVRLLPLWSATPAPVSAAASPWERW
jgi:murein DD-endopeptidase MepM/ murein hydrolase activator NlpD